MNYNQPATLQAAILDWAGTVVDFGSFAPTQIFVEAFAEFGVQVSLEEARGPMGMGKWDHIRTLCDIPAIAERYRAVFGRLPSDDDVTAIYERFMPLQIEKIVQGAAGGRTGARADAYRTDVRRFASALPDRDHRRAASGGPRHQCAPGARRDAAG